VEKNNHIIRFCIAIFCAIIFHSSLAAILFFLDLPSLIQKEKTIPFLLVSADRKPSIANQKQLSEAENAQAAQDYLTTLNQSSFQERRLSSKNNDTSGDTQGKQQLNKKTPPELPSITLPARSQHSNTDKTFQGLQNIFNKKKIKAHSIKKQISTKSIELLSDYELKLLNRLAKDELYDPFHRVMKEKNRRSISYTLTLTLFSHGAIKNAQIKLASGIPEIDILAIKTAYIASPYPTPPKEDREQGYKYNIPIIYQALTGD